jgi:hypothetical protein
MMQPCVVLRPLTDTIARVTSLRFGLGTYNRVEFLDNTGDVLLRYATDCGKPLKL